MSGWLRRFGGGSRSRLKLSQSLGAFPMPGGDISPLHVVFTVANQGEDEVRLVRACVLPEGADEPRVSVLEGDHALPGALRPGETAKLWLRARALASKMKGAGYGGRPRLRLVVEDEDGSAYETTFRLRVDEYLRLEDE